MELNKQKVKEIMIKNGLNVAEKATKLTDHFQTYQIDCTPEHYNKIRTYLCQLQLEANNKNELPIYIGSTPDIPLIIWAVCDTFNTCYNEINIQTRKREVVIARQMVMYLAYKHYSKYKLGSETSIAKIFNKDHATLIHACKVIPDLIETNKEIASNIKSITDKIKSKLNKI